VYDEDARKECADNVNSSSTSVVVPAGPHAEYLGQISRAWDRAQGEMMKVARLCAEASQRLTAKDRKALVGQLPFEQSTFSKFVQIGKWCQLKTPDVKKLLPHHYTIVYPLTGLSEEDFSAAIEERVIHPDMKRVDLQKWLRSRKGSKQLPSAQVVEAPFSMPDIPKNLDRRPAALTDHNSFERLQMAWDEAATLRQAWSGADLAARRRFVEEVLGMVVARASA
jgi:hypothetical protein